MTETQEYLLDQIKFFDDFCRENGIEYFLAGGTLLGAIRHRGFLPWDDDIDLYIKSSEWERAGNIFTEKLPDNYEVVSRETSPLYRNSIIRIADKSTSAYYRSRLADDTAHGVQIELFRLDPISDDPAERDEFYGEHWAYSEAENPYAILNEGRLDYRKLSFDAYKKLEQAFHDGDKETTDAAYKRLHRWSEDECTMYHEDWASYWLLYPISAFRNKIYVPFEDTMLPAPIGFADVLYGEYGDTWMEIPKAANRAVHNNIENYDIPYQYMQDLIEKQIDRKPYLEALRDRKIRLVEKEFHLDRITRRRMEMENEYLAERYGSEAFKTDCREAFEARDWRRVMWLTEGLRDKQWEGFGRSYIYRIDPEVMYAILYACFMQGEFKFIDRVERFSEKKPDGRTQQLFDDLRTLRKLRYSYFYSEMYKYRENHKEMLYKYPSQIHLNILDVIYRMGDGEDPAELLEEVKNLTIQAGRISRLSKLEADLLIRTGRVKEAKALYVELLKTSNDGMVINEIMNMEGKI